MSSKDPAFLFYSKDWLEGTAEMTPTEKGIYVDLLCYQHQRGFLPEDTKRIALLVGMAHDEFLIHWEMVGSKFAKQTDGKLLNKKLLTISAERKAHSRVRAIVGTFGALLRILKTSDTNKQKLRKMFNAKDFELIPENELSDHINIWLATCLPNCQAKAKQTIGIGDGIEDINIEYPSKTEIFIQAWQRWKKYKIEQHNFQYKSRDSEQTAINKLWKDCGQDESVAIDMIAGSIGNGWQGIFKDKNSHTIPKKETPEERKQRLISENRGMQ